MAVPGYPTVPQYSDVSPAVPSRPSTVELQVDGHVFALTTDRGVFSAGALDHGTRVLLNAVPPPPSRGALLDLGCGYGPIALTMASRARSLPVWAVDVNERAVALTASNAAAAGLGNVHAVTPDGVPADLRFSAIWSNPPVRIGKQAMREVLTEWLDRLEPEGVAHLVVQRNLGADSLTEWMRAEGWPATKVGSKQGFRVIRVGARPGPAER